MKKVKQILKNKFFLATVCFLVWMTFFDPKDWQTISNKKQKFQDLQKSEAELSKKIDDTKNELVQLKSSAQTIEKYARENYLLKRANEDIFIVQSK